MTCHNRKQKTINCITHLFKNELPLEYRLEVFLVDDGSIDGTAKAVSSNFPDVSIIQGDGNLFWNQGMRLAWKEATQAKEDYDFYIWLNDDTILDNDAIRQIIDDHKTVVVKNNKPAIISAACRKSVDDPEFSYGGRTDDGPVIPNGSPQRCRYINGNFVLVPKEIYKEIGILSDDYTHGMGDYDYGLRAQQAEYPCYTTSKYLATCPNNLETPKWCNPNVNLIERWKHFHAPTGLNIHEYIVFRKKFWGMKWIWFSVKAYTQMFFPIIYNNI